MRLTPVQKKFLNSIEYEFIKNNTLDTNVMVECSGYEWRTAVSLSKKGLVKLDREITDKIRSKDKFKVKVVDNNNNLKMSLIFYSIKELLSELENIIKINGK
ncbi:MAG: hypothetical protein AABY32_01140 [Nanoarchaeota archaeon]